FSDVLNQFHYGVNRTVSAAHRFGRDDRMNDPAIFANPSFVQRIPINFARNHAVELLSVIRQIVGMRQFGPTRLQQLLALVSKNATAFLIDFKKGLGRRSDCHPDQSEFEVTPEAVLTSAQRVGGSLTLDEFGGQMGVKIDKPQFVFGRAVRLAKVTRDHSQHFVATTEKGGGLYRTKAG